MLHDAVICLLVAAFAGAGLFNAIGTRATQEEFARWGYPRWLCRMTGALEIASGALSALPASRGVGLSLDAVSSAAAVVTVLRRRELSHAAPLAALAVLLALAAATS